ncbi:MAG TPA: hypothetical protein DEH25_04725, partial [Chloroflexi bacterium]|nr:hypothetical protein [Chloroflexota bacterium]
GARGIIFDDSDHLFIADTHNQRVQVFDISGGTPVYSSTIGVTDVISDTAGYFNRPSRIALDSSNRLYITDTENGRVQRCSYSSGWACTIFDTGLSYPLGITADGSDNIFITQLSGTLRKCTSSGVCSDFASAPYGFQDVALDSLGNVYASAPYEDVVLKFEADGTLIGVYLGEEFVPYITDENHFNGPRLATDPAGNLIVIEQAGNRLLKFDPAGTLLWSAGTPGVDAWDNEHFNFPFGVASDSAGKIYVADGNRVQIYTPDGDFEATLGNGYGSGDYDFAGTSGIAVGPSGNLYVADCNNQRVQVFDSNLTYMDTIGETGVAGDDEDHLRCPNGVEVDAAGNLYVADSWNCRVQKFDSNLDYAMTFGTTGSCSEQFSDVNPEDVAVDAAGRVYIAGWNQRVQVFDASGAYLTTIGGQWGTHTSQFKRAAAVDVDHQGNVFVADFDNFRIQKFALGVPNWQQVNLNGFGRFNSAGVATLEIFGEQLYAGVSNWELGAQVWRSPDGDTWEAVSDFGLSNVYTNVNPTVTDLIEFNGQLYAGTAWSGAPGQIWRSPDGTTWNEVTNDGFGNGSNMAIARFAVFNNQIYASTGNANQGCEIWRSSTGNPGNWARVVTGGNGNPNNSYVNTFAIFNGYLYAAGENETEGAEIWRTANGTSWAKVNANGFGEADNIHIGSLVIFDNMLYAATRNNVTGAQIWHSHDGTNWMSMMLDGFGDLNNIKIEALLVFGNRLVAVTNNPTTGAEVWSSFDGHTWEQLAPDGFGDSNNTAPLWNSSTITFLDQLYIGTWNWGNGGELWRYEPPHIYLPLVIR